MELQVACLTVRHLNHYTKLFSVLVWGHKWTIFMLGWFCPIHLIHWIRRKSVHFGKTSMWGAAFKDHYQHICTSLQKKLQWFSLYFFCVFDLWFIRIKRMWLLFVYLPATVPTTVPPGMCWVFSEILTFLPGRAKLGV